MMIPLFDAHADTLFRCMSESRSLRGNDLHIDLERASKYAPYAQFFAVWLRPESFARALPDRDMDEEVLFSLCNHGISRLLLELKSNSDIINLCRSADEAELAAREGKSAAFISVEGAELLKCSEAELERAQRLGVKAVNLCWNFANKLCGSCVQEKHRGLSEAGKSFVRRAQELDMIIDLSHCSEPAFWDAVEIAKKPLMASHSNSRRLCDHPRNLSDTQFKALVATGGIAGINFYSDFLASGGATLGDVVSHIEHFLSLGGEKALALGSDFDGVDTTPPELRGIEDCENLYNELLKRNYSESLVQDIFYNNLLRLIGEY